MNYSRLPIAGILMLILTAYPPAAAPSTIRSVTG